MSDAVPISEATEQRLAQAYPPAQHERLRAMLREYGVAAWQQEVERVRYDILHLADGDLERVRKLVDTALRDPRDVMSLEYFRQEGKSVPHEWAKRNAVNQKPFDAEAYRAERRRRREARRSKS